MLSDGNLNILHHLSEPENFYGKKDIPLIQMKKKLLNRSILSLISIEESMKMYLLYPSSKESSLKVKNSLEDILPPLLKLLSQKMEELFREPLLINLDKISQKCLILLLKIKKKKKFLLGKPLGDLLPVLLELWFFIMVITKV